MRHLDNTTTKRARHGQKQKHNKERRETKEREHKSPETTKNSRAPDDAMMHYDNCDQEEIFSCCGSSHFCWIIG